MFLPIEVMMWVIPLLIFQISLIILCLINIVKSKEKSTGNKIGWSVIIICITLIGAILYYFLGWEKKVK
ncbi:MAG: transcriptional regulator [Candidatus Lokiarchaeota archaeon]|nr:transcriptional regulator [Candidatus Lokiarchaeota archaeon]